MKAPRGWVGLLALALALAGARGAWALGLGELSVTSRLGQPLAARIALVGVRGGNLETLRVGLASHAVYRAAGALRDPALEGLRLEVVASGEGAPYIRLSTRESMREPALRLVVEANWSRGRARRDYVLLLGGTVR